MKIKLLNLTITSFKGLKSYHLDPQGKDVTVSGENGTGKSTLFDAFTWLLFGKDSHGATKFWAKPRDEQGNEIEGAEPIVEAKLQIDTAVVMLRRELRENWVQHRGELERERKSDTTKLFINGVPKKLGEYQAYIDSLISEDLFKLLTVPGSFNELPVAKQRGILMTMFPEVNDQEVIASDDQLATLNDLLAGQSVDDVRKQITYQRRELKRKVDGIPERIDEAERAKPVPEAKQSQLQEMQAEYEKFIAGLQDQILVAKNTDDNSARLKQIEELKVELSEKKRSYEAGVDLLLGGLSDDFRKQQDSVDDLEMNKNKLLRQVDDAKARIATAKASRTKLLEDYHSEKSVTFDDDSLVCPTCGQELPADKADDLRKHFNTEHSNRLANLIDQGKTVAADITDWSGRLDSLTSKLADVNKQLAAKQARLDEIVEEVQEKRARAADWESTPDYQKLTGQIDDLESASSNNSQQKQIDELTKKLEAQQAGLTSVKAELLKFDQIAAQDKRIEELKKEEEELKATAQQLEGQDYLLQRFTRAKSKLIETKLNKLFQVVEFHLFDTQKDGTVVDTVRTTVGGIDYDAGLNTGARMKAGLDIINALDRQHGVEAPIFIDNAEGLTNVFPTDAQQIRLQVTDDKTLKVEE